jgi:isopenicillin N synthase-like dioxygenase
MMPDGEWVPQPIVPGAFLVNAGQILKRWTNNRFRATPHRVMSPTAGVPRYSIPFFFNPGREANIDPVPACIDAEHPRAHEPIKYWQHIDQYLANAYRT